MDDDYNIGVGDDGEDVGVGVVELDARMPINWRSTAPFNGGGR